MIAHAAVRGIHVEELESELEGDIDLRGFLGLSNDVPKGYTNIRVRFRAKADAENIAKLRRLAEFSPVFNTLIYGPTSRSRSSRCKRRHGSLVLYAYYAVCFERNRKGGSIMGKVQIKTTWDYEIALDENAIAQFDASFQGELIRPGDEAYESARRVYNAMIDKHPRLIARAIDVADVITCVNFARENGLLLAVRGGGHNGGGLGTCDNGLVLDLSLMKGIRVDPDSRTVRAEGGCTQGEIGHAAAAFGLAIPAGIVSGTGIAGLTLGGGHGYLTRKYGLSHRQPPGGRRRDRRRPSRRCLRRTGIEDLFWAIRGGGGNFGVVTSFLFRLHPVSTVTAGPDALGCEQTAEMMRWYREFMPAATGGSVRLLRVHERSSGAALSQPLCTAGPSAAWSGVIWARPSRRRRTWTPIRDASSAAVRADRPHALSRLCRACSTRCLPPGLQWYWKGDFVSELSDEAIEQHVKYGTQLPSLLSTMHLYPVDGQVGRIGRNDTAFSYREAKWSMVIAGIDPDPANAEKITRWAKDYWNALHPYCAGGAYVNFMMDEGSERVRATYRDNYDRLVAIKAKYDPGNLFRSEPEHQARGVTTELSRWHVMEGGREHGCSARSDEHGDPDRARRGCRGPVEAVLSGRADSSGRCEATRKSAGSGMG